MKGGVEGEGAVGVRVSVGTMVMRVSIGGKEACKECMIVCAIEVKYRGWLRYIVKVKRVVRVRISVAQGVLTRIGAWREMVIVRTADVVM